MRRQSHEDKGQRQKPARPSSVLCRKRKHPMYTIGASTRKFLAHYTILYGEGVYWVSSYFAGAGLARCFTASASLV
jgi:hypothetical protein